MVICPIALAVGCKKCPIVSVCPVKSSIGNYKLDPSPIKADPPKTKINTRGKRARTRRSRKR
jgi:hypothetical protein